VVFGLVLTTAGPRAQTPAAPAQKPKITMAGYPAPGETAKLTVLATGAEPKKALRYNIPATFKGRVEMVTSMNMTMNMMGQSMEMAVPAIKMGIDLAVTGVAPNGDISYSMAFSSMTVEGDASNPLVMQMQAASATITGVKGTTSMTNRGLTKDSNLDVADPATKAMLGQMTSSVENLLPAFPEEAVGVGARWEVRQAISAAEQTQFQKAVYEITAISGTSVSLKVTTENTAPPQPINAALAAAAGGEMMLDKMSGTGTGTMTVSLDSLTPTTSVAQTSSTAMTMNIQGQSMSIASDGKISVTVKPVKLP